MDDAMLNSSELLRALDCLAAPRLLVLGDLILDRYTWGDAERISQEAPVLVLRADKREARLGGAANVCAMVRGLEAEVSCVGVVGSDVDAADMRRLMDEQQIGSRLVLSDASRPTTVKERFIGRASLRHPSQILRVDREVRDALSAELEQRLISGIHEQVAEHDVLLISDYGKGVCTPRVVREAIAAARAAGIPVLVDPGRGVAAERYRGATLLKPNRLETELATGRPLKEPSDALDVGRQLCEQHELQMAVITMDSDGMALVSRDGPSGLFPTQRRAVYDVTGAGDIVFAMLGIGLGSGLTPAAAVGLSNVAGGLEVERAGVALVRRDEVRGELLATCRVGAEKIVSLERASQLLRGHRERGERVALTNGCFDLLHVGHVSYLAEAASMGDRLVVAINSDESVRRLKGPQRPVINQTDRAAMLAALSCVDYVLVFDEDTPNRLLEILQPDVLVKGGTYAPHEVVGREIVERYGGKICLTNVVDGVSTTRIIRSVTDRSVTDRSVTDPSQGGTRLREAG